MLQTEQQPLIALFKRKKYVRVLRWSLEFHRHKKEAHNVKIKANIVANALVRGHVGHQNGKEENGACNTVLYESRKWDRNQNG